MPYKAIGEWVYVHRDGKWEKYKRYESAAEAKKRAEILEAIVMKALKGKKG